MKIYHWPAGVPAWVLVEAASLNGVAPLRVVESDPRQEGEMKLSPEVDEACCLPKLDAATIAAGAPTLLALPFAVAERIAVLGELYHDARGDAQNLRELLGAITLPLEGDDDIHVKVSMDGDDGDPSVGIAAHSWWELEAGYVVVREADLKRLRDALSWGRGCVSEALRQEASRGAADPKAWADFVHEADAVLGEET